MPMDSGARSELSQLRTEMNELESRMMDHLIHLSWRWVVAINLASLALAVAILEALIHKP
jgi:hypothetical protein